MPDAFPNRERLEQARTELSGLISEMIARLGESDGFAFPDLIDPSVPAAKLAATLGFPCPPVEMVTVLRGRTPDPILEENPEYINVNRMDLTLTVITLR